MTVDRQKLRNAILYFAKHPGVHNLGLTKLYKMLYYADVWRMRETLDESITGSEYIKYPHGPVPSRGEQAIKKLRREGLIETRTEDHHGLRLTAIRASTASDDVGVFDEDEVRILERVATEFGPLTAKELSNRSHEEPSWVHAASLAKLDPVLMLYGDEEDPEGL